MVRIHSPRPFSSPPSDKGGGLFCICIEQLRDFFDAVADRNAHACVGAPVLCNRARMIELQAEINDRRCIARACPIVNKNFIAASPPSALGEFGILIFRDGVQKVWESEFWERAFFYIIVLHSRAPIVALCGQACIRKSFSLAVCGSWGTRF